MEVWLGYSVVVAVSFVIVKFVNYRLHHMFDTEEVIEIDSSVNSSDIKSEKDASKTSETAISKSQTQG